MIRVGDIDIARVVEYDGPLFMPTELLPDAQSEALEKELAWLVPRHYDTASRKLVNCVQGFAFRTRHHAFVIDTCVGNAKQNRRKPEWNGGDWPYLANLAAAGPVTLPHTRGEALSALTRFLHDNLGPDADLVTGRLEKAKTQAEFAAAVERCADMLGAMRGAQKAQLFRDRAKAFAAAHLGG